MKHVAFADDLGGAGELLELRRWCPTAASSEDEPRTTEGKWPGKDEGCLELVNNIAINVRKLRPEQKGILQWAQP